MVGQSEVTISPHPQDQWSLSGPPVVQVLSSSQLALRPGMPVPNLCFHSVPDSSPDLDGTLDADPCRPPGPSLMGRLLIWTCTPCLCSGAQTPQDSEGPSILQEAPAPLLSSVAATEGLQVVRKVCLIAPCLERPYWRPCGGWIMKWAQWTCVWASGPRVCARLTG